MVAERTMELIGMLMIGEGILTVVEPRRHPLLWRSGPPAWRKMIDPFVRRPEMTRYLGAVEAAAGLWLATRQMNRWEAEHPAYATEALAEAR